MCNLSILLDTWHQGVKAKRIYLDCHQQMSKYLSVTVFFIDLAGRVLLFYTLKCKAVFVANICFMIYCLEFRAVV